MHTHACNKPVMIARGDSSGSEDWYDFTQEAPELWSTHGEGDIEFLRDENLHEVFRGSASANNFGEAISVHPAELTERNPGTFFDRVQMRLQDPNGPWNAWVPDLSDVDGEMGYPYSTGVLTTAGNRCDRDVVTFSKSVESKSTFYTASSELGSVAVREHKPRLEK
jgi:hypothetical protein